MSHAPWQCAGMQNIELAGIGGSMLRREHAGKRVWYVEHTERAVGWTLRGGFPKAMMREDPSLRQCEIGAVFAYKKGLLRHLGGVQFRFAVTD